MESNEDFLGELTPINSYETLVFYDNYSGVLSILLNTCNILPALVVAVNMLQRIGMSTADMPPLEWLVRSFRMQVFGGDSFLTRRFAWSWGSILGGKVSTKGGSLKMVDVGANNEPVRLIDTSFSICMSYSVGGNMVFDLDLRRSLISGAMDTVHDGSSQYGRTEVAAFLKNKIFCQAHVLVETSNITAVEKNKGSSLVGTLDFLKVYTSFLDVFAHLQKNLERSTNRSKLLKDWIPDAEDRAYGDLDAMLSILRQVDITLFVSSDRAAREDSTVQCLEHAVRHVRAGQAVVDFQRYL
jgi:hypothetical protein